MALASLQDDNEGILNPDRDMYRIWLDHYNPLGILVEKAYFEFIMKPREDKLNTLKLLVLNRSYG